MPLVAKICQRLGIGLVCGLGGLYVASEYTDVKHIGIIRFGRAAFTISSIGFDYHRVFNKYSEDHPKRALKLSSCHLRSALKLRELCTKNGGCFIKVGQHLGSLDYLLPDEYVSTLRVLHDDAPRASFADVKLVLEQELGQPIESIFAEISPDPIGSASLAQVHWARLHNGVEVAVKVQHKEVLYHSQIDMATMSHLVNLVARLFPKFKFVWLADETKKNLPLELSFLNEAKNSEEVKRRMGHLSYLKIPTIHHNLSTNRVLVMEYCPGIKVNDKIGLEKVKISPLDVSKKLTKIFSEMIYEEGFIHCDPHHGNILIRPCPNSRSIFTYKGFNAFIRRCLSPLIRYYEDCEIILLDHGLYQTLTQEFRLSYCRLWLHILHGNVAGMKEESTNLGCGHVFGLFACMVAGRSWKSLTAGLKNIPVSKEEKEYIRDQAVLYLPEVSDVLNSVPSQMLLIFKCNDLLRGVESSLGCRHSYRNSFVIMMQYCARALVHAKYLEMTLYHPPTSYWKSIQSSVSFFPYTMWLYWQYLRISLQSLLLKFALLFDVQR